MVASTAEPPPSHAWLLAVLTMSNPARASAAAAAAGAVKTPAESGAAESVVMGLSRFPNVMSAAASESCNAMNGYRVSPCNSRSLASRRPRLMSPTA